MDTAPLNSPSSDLRPRNFPTSLNLCATLFFSAWSLKLSLSSSLVAQLAGQSLLAISLLQWFVILHECGHKTLFRHKALSFFVGDMASLAAFISFLCWNSMHRQHHNWTGWLDRAPTTLGLLNFDAHELHHMSPFVPGYCLRRIPHQPANEIGRWRRLRTAKKLRGEFFLLRNREQSGVYL